MRPIWTVLLCVLWLYVAFLSAIVIGGTCCTTEHMTKAWRGGQCLGTRVRFVGSWQGEILYWLTKHVVRKDASFLYCVMEISWSLFVASAKKTVSRYWITTWWAEWKWWSKKRVDNLLLCMSRCSTVNICGSVFEIGTWHPFHLACTCLLPGQQKADFRN